LWEACELLPMTEKTILVIGKFKIKRPKTEMEVLEIDHEKKYLLEMEVLDLDHEKKISLWSRNFTLLYKCSRPDISNAVRELSKCMDEAIWGAFHGTLRDIKFLIDTKDLELQI
jgi:hypothetical protein